MSGGTRLKCLSPQGKSFVSLSTSVGDLWRGMASPKSHVSKLKNWVAMHSKKLSVGIELRAGGEPHRSEQAGWSAGDMIQ